MLPKFEQFGGPTAEIELPEGRITFDEFLLLDEERVEWIDGEIIAMSPTTSDHDRIVFFIARILADFVDNNGLGEVITGNLVMRLGQKPSGRIPDMFFVKASRLHLVGPAYLDGPADVALEVVSRDSINRGGRDKFSEYARAGVAEYWLVDSLSDRCEFYALTSGGMYEQIEPDAAGILHSGIVDGFWLNPEWLRRRPLPSPTRIGKEYTR